MGTKSQKFKNFFKSAADLIRKGLNSKIFPFFTAALMLISNYVGLDIFVIYYVCIAGILIALLLDDVTPIISLFIMMNVVISEKNSPSEHMRQIGLGSATYYTSTAITVQLAVLIGLWVLALMYRAIVMVKNKKFKITPMFFGLCGLAAALMLNGVGGGNYDLRDLAYGAMIGLLLLFLFFVIKDNVKISEENFVKIAYYFVAISVLLLVELAVTYLTRPVIVDGTFVREQIEFGWGPCLNMGGWLLFCIPAVLYLARKYKYGYLFTGYSIVLLLGIVLSSAKSAMFGAVIIYPLCLIPLFKGGKNRLLHLFVLGAAALIAIIAAASLWQKLARLFSDLFSSFVNEDGSLNGNGRMEIWGMAIDSFKYGPVFGGGFFDNRTGLFDLRYMQTSGIESIIPIFYQNTLLQFLGSCGIFGLLAYVIHRVQTIACFFSNVNYDRSFIATVLLAIIGLSLVDCYFFSLLPTTVYIALVAVLVASGKKYKSKKAELLAA